MTLANDLRPDDSHTGKAAERPIRIDRFTTALHEPDQQFAFWHDLVSPILKVTPEGTSTSSFHASGRAYHLGCLRLVSLRMDALEFRHTQEHIDATGIDHWCLSVTKTGAMACRTNTAAFEFPAGSLSVLSLAGPFAGRSSATDALILYLSRDDFHEIAAELDTASHRRVAGPMVSLLNEFLLNAEAYLPTMKISEVSVLVETLSLLIRAAFNPTADAIAAANLPMSVGRFDLVRKYIQENLGSPDLGATSVCKALDLSRRQLYYLFDRHGGVARYIKQRRLNAACRALANSGDTRLISTIAYACGYTNQALFSRHFQAEFGFGPREARAAKLCGYLPRTSAPTSFSEWLGQGRAC